MLSESIGIFFERFYMSKKNKQTNKQCFLTLLTKEGPWHDLICNIIQSPKRWRDMKILILHMFTFLHVKQIFCSSTIFHLKKDLHVWHPFFSKLWFNCKMNLLFNLCNYQSAFDCMFGICVNVYWFWFLSSYNLVLKLTFGCLNH